MKMALNFKFSSICTEHDYNAPKLRNRKCRLCNVLVVSLVGKQHIP